MFLILSTQCHHHPPPPNVISFIFLFLVPIDILSSQCHDNVFAKFKLFPPSPPSPLHPSSTKVDRVINKRLLLFSSFVVFVFVLTLLCFDCCVFFVVAHHFHLIQYFGSPFFFFPTLFCNSHSILLLFLTRYCSNLLVSY